MPANPNWARWIFASVADHLKQVATNVDLPILVEHFDERTETFERASPKAEIRITGPFTSELSANYFRIWVDANVLLTDRYDGSRKNPFDILKYAGLFHEAMDSPIPVWNYGSEPGDYVAGQPDTQVFLGCLVPRSGNSDSVRVINFGQIHATDKLKQTAVDARYVLYLADT
jgi:hypothetical protein